MRCEQYPHQHSTFRRWEIEGEALVVTSRISVTPYRGKDVPTTQIRWVGQHWCQMGDKEPYLADQSMIFDAGPKLGVTVCVTPHPETPPTEEERAATRARINEVCLDLFGRRAIFPGEETEEPYEQKSCC